MEIIKCFCNKCRNITNHSILHEEKVDWEDEEAQIEGHNAYRIIKCLGCDDISYQTKSCSSDDLEYDENGPCGYDPTYYHYPLLKEGFGSVEKLYEMVPYSIAKLYSESANAIANKDYILAAAGLRATIEAICVSTYKKTGNLINMIDTLKNKGILSSQDASFLHSVRFMGNDAIHHYESPTKEQIILIIKIVERLLETMYVYKKKAIDILKFKIDNYDDFVTLFKLRMKKIEINKSFTIEELLINDKDRIDNYSDYIQKIKKEIEEDNYKTILKDDSSKEKDVYMKVSYYTRNKIKNNK